VLAIVPAHDEATRVAAVVEGLKEQGLPVLVVDDGSTDSTGLMAEGAGARVLRLEPNQGKGAALKAGFRAALTETAGEGARALSGGTSVGVDHEGQPDSDAHPSDEPPAGAAEVAGLWAAILTLDGDGQHDPAEVPGFLRIWRETGADLVVGARDYRQMPPIRWFTNTVSRHLFSWALGEQILDNQSGFRLCSRRLAEAALSSPERGFAFEVEEIAICVGRGYRLAWVPIRTIYGTESSDIKPWAHFVGFVRVTRRARRRMREERSRVSGR
jgi:glycosyltransferase involved in cell wall biosynthesis